MDAPRTSGRSLRSDKRGATAIEYGLIVALIVIAIVGALGTLGTGSNSMWGRLDGKVGTVLN